MLEGLLDPARWELTFAESGPLWEGFAFTLQVVIAGLLLSLVLGTIHLGRVLHHALAHPARNQPRVR